MALDGLSRYLVLPELLLLKVRAARHGGTELFAEKVSPMEVCPRCATPVVVLALLSEPDVVCATGHRRRRCRAVSCVSSRWPGPHL